MKSFIQIACASILLFASYQSFAQIAWNEIPAIPANPSAGQTSPQSYDVSIADDGRMYASYIYDNGSNQQIYFQEYVPGTGWSLMYNDFVYSGFEAIHSFKQGNNIYVIVKRDDATAADKFRIYLISSGSVSLVNDIIFSDIQNGADYRAVLSENGSYIYILHKDLGGSYLNITQFNLGAGTSTSQSVPTGSSTVFNYDLTEHQDTVYIGSTRAETTSYFTYLHKIPADMSGVIPHHPGNVDGQLGGVVAASTLQGMVMSKDVINHTIRILTREETSNFQYIFIPATLTTTFCSSLNFYDPHSNIPAASVSTNTKSLYFGSFNTAVSSTGYVTEVIQHDYTTDQSSLYSGFDFNGVADQSSNCHFSYADPIDKAIAVLYDGIQSKTRYYYSNHTPSMTSSGTVYTICPMVTSPIITGLELTDIDGQAISITDISAADGSMFPAGSLTSTLINQAGNSTYFTISGTPAMSGTTTLTITFTDGLNTATASITVSVISTAAAPTFNQTTISVCSNNGMVDLSEYVSTPGGTFNISGSSAPFDGPLYNSNLTGLPYETAMQLDYTITSVGCNLTASTQFIFHESAIATITPTPTTCGGNTGSAVATISGGMSPFTLQAWSSGETGVTSVNNLAQGTYTFTVQGANSCTVIQEFTIVPTGVDIIPTITNSTCYGANNGSISTTLNGFTAPTTMIWSSGYSVPSISNLVPGTYTLTITDAANCVYTEAFTVTQPAQLTAITVVNSPTCGNSDGTMEVQNIAGGVAPYSVSWSSGGTNALETNVPYGVYSATITDNTSCQTIKTVYVSEQNSGNLTGSITGTQCGSNTGQIDVTPILVSGTAVQAISWSSGQTTEDISSVASGTYVCTLTTDANCHAVKGWDIPIVAPDLQPICVITVDSATSTNLVVWEEIQPVGIHHYNIYRETSIQGEYILIDTVEATNTSLFNDVVASPIARSWSYKISAVNGCNTEGPLSPQHRTMHLNAIDGGSAQTAISWNPYEGTSYSNFVLSRYTNALGWETVATLPPTQFTYTDNTDFTTPGLDYMVELNLDEQCTALLYKAQDFNTTRSNKDKGNFVLGNGTGNSNNGLSENSFSYEIYPNPITDLLHFTITENGIGQKMHVISASGQELETIEINSSSLTIDLRHLAQGLYYIHVDGSPTTLPIIKN